MFDYVLSKLEQFLETYRQKKLEDRRLADDALRAVQLALNETEIYYARLDRGTPRSDEAELQLSRYWSAASVPLRHIDMEFADICEHKSRYWLNPESWDERKVSRYRIRLTSVAKKVKKLRGIGVARLSLAKKKRT